VQISANLNEPTKTRDVIAKAAGVSHDTVSKVEQIHKAHNEGLVDDATIDKLRRKETSINKVASAIKESKTAQEVAEKIERKPAEKKQPKVLDIDSLTAVDRFDDRVMPLLVAELDLWPVDLYQLFRGLVEQFLEERIAQ
jgi:hypothetical protein